MKFVKKPSTNYALYHTPCPPISDELFYLFHTIDRKLYTQLIINLGRDPAESLQVMGFWLWLEQDICLKMNLVSTLLQLPDTLVNEVADESVMCLKCVETDHLPLPTYELAVLPNLVGQKISLQVFHENRTHVIHGTAKMVSLVCVRAFTDILQKTFGKTSFYTGETSASTAGETVTSITGSGEASCSNGLRINSGISYVPSSYATYPIFSPIGSLLFHVSPVAVGAINMPQTLHANEHAYARAPQQEDPSYDITSLLGRLNPFDDDDDDVLSADERAVFLTFSKGYPISETEVIDFFTRRFGDVTQAIHMQEVSRYEQVLYARLIVRSAAIVDLIVDGGRAKYTINGKHVWARKYVKK